MSVMPSKTMNYYHMCPAAVIVFFENILKNDRTAVYFKKESEF